MKFNEKIIELRKKEGLSQEELGYKLNVTRQTVSKWELGQTTPEMDKLVEMSKIFNISVDDLINESEISTSANPVIEDQPIKENKTREKNIKIIIIAVLILVIVLIVVRLFAAFSLINNVNDTSKDIIQNSGNLFERIFGIFDKQIDNIEKNEENAQNIIEDTKNKIEDANKKIDMDRFNNPIEIYNGTQTGHILKALLDNVITSNKKEERKITVKFLETETQEETKIKEMKRNIETFDNYEVTFEYDTDGFINRTIIEKL